MIKIQILSKASNQVLASIELMEGEMKEFSETEVLALFKEETIIEVVEGQGLGLREEGDMVFLFSNGETLRFRKYYPLVEEGRIAQADIQGIEVPAPDVVSVDTDSFGLDEDDEAFDLDIEEREGRSSSDPSQSSVAAPSPALALAPFFVQEPAVLALAPQVSPFPPLPDPPPGELDLSRGRIVDDLYSIQLQAKSGGGAATTEIPTGRFVIGTSLTSLLAQNGPLFPTGEPAVPSVVSNDTYQDQALKFRALEAVRLEQAPVRNPNGIANNTTSGDFTRKVTDDSGVPGEFTGDPKGEFTLQGNYGQVWLGRTEGKVVYQIDDSSEVRAALFGVGKDGYVQDVFKAGILLKNFDILGQSIQVKSEFAVRIFGINDAPTAHNDQPLWPADKDLSPTATPLDPDPGPNTPAGSQLRVILVVERASAEMNPVLEPVGVGGDTGEIRLVGRDLIGATAPSNSLFANDIDADLKVGVIRVTQINGVSGSTSLVVTAPGHGLKAGDLVALDGLVGSSTNGSNVLSELNTQFEVVSFSGDTFTVRAATAFGGSFTLTDPANGGSGMVAVVPSPIGAQNPNPLDALAGTSTLVVYAPDHRLVIGDTVVLRGISGTVGGINGSDINGLHLVVSKIENGGKFNVSVPGKVFNDSIPGSVTDLLNVGGADVTLQKVGVFGTSGNLTAVSNERPADLEWVVFPLKSASTITGAGDVAADNEAGVQTLERTTPTALTVIEVRATNGSPVFRVVTPPKTDDNGNPISSHGMELGDRVTLAGLPLSIGGVNLMTDGGNVRTFTVTGISGLNQVLITEDKPTPVTATSSQTVSALVGAAMTETGVLLKGLFGDLVFKVDGSFTYTRNTVELTAAEITANAKDGFVVQLRDEANLRMQELRIQIPLGVADPAFAANSTIGGSVNATGAGYTLPDRVGFNLASDWTGFNITRVEPLNSGAGAAVDVGAGDTLSIVGQFGTLTVNRWSGHYTYVLNQKSVVVEALTGQESTAPTDKFQYTVFDGNSSLGSNAGALSSTAVLTLTIRGSNDSPALSVTSSLAASNVEDQIVVLTGGALDDGIRGSRDLATILATLGDTHTLVEGDPDDGSADLTYTLSAVPSATLEGSMVRLTSAGGAVSQVLGVNDTFTHAEVTAGLIGFRPVNHFNTQKNGIANDVPTSVTLTLRDGGEDNALAFAGVTVTLTLTRINDEPTLVGVTAGPVNFTEPSAPVITNELPASGALAVGPLYDISKLLPGPDTATFAGADPEHDQVIDQIILRVTGVVNGANEKLVWGGIEVPLVAGPAVNVTINDATATAFTFTVTVTNAGSGNLDVTITGALRVVNPGVLAGTGDDVLLDQPRIVLNSLHYRNVAENADGPARTFTIRSIQDNIASGDRLLDGLNVQTVVNVTATNDAPVIVSTGAAVLATISEDALGVQTTVGDIVTVANPGNTVANILASNGNLTDVDLLSGVFNPLQGLALTAATVTAGAGTWQFSTNGGTTWQAVGTVSGTEALLLRSQDLLRFLPDQVGAATGRIEFRGWDQTSGTFSNKVDVTANGGQTAFSADTKLGDITITAVNDAPQLAATAGNGAYTENAVAVVIDGGVTVTDVDELDTADGITAGEVRISSGFTAGDELIFVDQNGIMGSYNAGTGVLTLSGAATELEYQTALQSVTFRSTSEDPTLNSATRTVLFSVTDANGSAAGNGLRTGTVTRTIDITAINDEPTLVSTATNPTFAENGAGAALFGSTTISTIEAGQTVTRLDLSISNLADGEAERLTVDGTTFNLTDGTNGTTGGVNAMVFSVAVSGGVATVSLTKAAGITPAAAQTLVNGISYLNVSDTPTTGDLRVATLLRIDDSGSNVAPNDNTTTLAVASTISVTATNDAPQLVATAGNGAYTENAVAVVIDGGVTVTDVDELDTADGITAGEVRISSGFTAGDELTFVDQNGITGSYNAGTGVLTLSGAATELEYQTALQSVTFRSTSEDPTSISATRTVLFSVTDANGSVAGNGVQTGTVTRTINITAINDEPTLVATATNPTFAENGAGAALFGSTTISTIEAGQTVTRLDLSISNLADGAAERLTVDGTTFNLTDGTNGTTSGVNAMVFSVAVSGGVATLSLTKAVGITTAAAQTMVNGISYLNVSDTPTTGALRVATLLRVDDSGSNVAPNDNTASLAVASTITVTATNDAPQLVATAGNGAYTENAVAVVIDGGVTVTDADEVDAADGITAGEVRISSGFTAGDELIFVDQNGITGSYNAGTGVLTLSGAATESEYQTALQSVTFRSTSDVPTSISATRTVLFSVTDANGSGAGNGVQTGTVTRTINITAINDEPTLVATAANPTFAENGAGAALFGSTTISTIEAGQTVTRLDLSISNLADGAAERLTVDGTTFNLTNGTNGTTSGANAMAFSVSVSGGVATVSLTKAAGITPAAAQTMVNGISYLNVSDTPTTGALRVATLLRVDDSGSNVAPNDNTTSLAVASTITVTATNDAPVLNFGAAAPDLSLAGAPIAPAAGITVTDGELSALSAGSGDFRGASFVVVRQGGANPSDVFSFPASFGGGALPVVSVVGGDLQIGGITFASFNNAANQVTVTFLAAAVAAIPGSVANLVMQSLLYDKTAGPTGPVVLEYTFSDGNSGAQGTGGVGTFVGTRSITVVAPVVLDLDGDGLNFVGANSDHALRFDVTGDGVKDSLAWVKSGDGALVYDADGDGKVSHRSEFVFTDWGGGRTDLEALAANFDSNSDGQLTDLDTDWSKFKIWQDLDSDGIFGTSELVSLDGMGILGLNLATSGPAISGLNDVKLHGLGTFEWADGSAGTLGDAAFAYTQGVALPPANEILNIDHGGVAVLPEISMMTPIPMMGPAPTGPSPVVASHSGSNESSTVTTTPASSSSGEGSAPPSTAPLDEVPVDAPAAVV